MIQGKFFTCREKWCQKKANGLEINKYESRQQKSATSWTWPLVRVSDVLGCCDDALQGTTEPQLAHCSGAHGRPQPALGTGVPPPPPGSLPCFFHPDEDTGLKDCPPHLGLWPLHATSGLRPCGSTGFSWKTLLALQKGCSHSRSR